MKGFQSEKIVGYVPPEASLVEVRLGLLPPSLLCLPSHFSALMIVRVERLPVVGRPK
jgi:hypothetical protein